MNINEIYELVKQESFGMNVVYEDRIVDKVGLRGYAELMSNGYIETCGIMGGRYLYALKEE